MLGEFLGNLLVNLCVISHQTGFLGKLRLQDRANRRGGHIGDMEGMLAADALLAGSYQVAGLQPLVQDDFAIGKQDADRHGELLAVILAFPDAGTMGLTFGLVVLLRAPAVWADQRSASRYSRTFLEL